MATNFKTPEDYWANYNKVNKNKKTIKTPTPKISKSSISSPFTSPTNIVGKLGRPAGSEYLNAYQKGQGGYESIGSIGLQSPLTEDKKTQSAMNIMDSFGEGTPANINLNAIGGNQVNPEFTRLKNTYGDFFSKNINTNTPLKTAIEGSFNKANTDTEYVARTMNQYLDNIASNINTFKSGGQNAINLYNNIKSQNSGDLGKNLLLDTYLKSQGVDTTQFAGTSGDQTFQVWDKNAPGTTPTQTAGQINPEYTKFMEGLKTTTPSTTTQTITTPTTPVSPTTPTIQTPTTPGLSDFEKGLNDYKIQVESDKKRVLDIGNKYGIDVNAINSYYEKALSNYEQGIIQNENAMSGALDSMVIDARKFTSDQIDTFTKMKNAALEEARIKQDKDILDKENYYNEVERTLKIQKIRNRNNDLLTQQTAIALGGALGERFGTGSVRFYNDAVREGDLLLTTIEDNILKNNNLRVQDLSNIRREYNNAVEKIDNSFINTVQNLNKNLLDTINNVVLQKGKTKTETLNAIKAAKDNYINNIINLQERKYTEQRQINEELRNIDSEYNKNVLATTQLQAEALQNQYNAYLKEKELGKTAGTTGSVSGPLDTNQVGQIIEILGGSKLSDKEAVNIANRAQTLANAGLPFNDIKTIIGKKVSIDDLGVYNIMKDEFANKYFVDGTNVAANFNNGNIEGGLREYENEVYANVNKVLGDNDLKGLNIVNTKNFYRDVERIKNNINNLSDYEKTGLFLTKTPEMIKSPARKQLDSSINDLLSRLTREMSGTAASEAEVDRLKKVIGAGEWRSSDDMITTLEAEKDKYLSNLNTQRFQIGLPPVSKDMISTDLQNYSFNYAPLYFKETQ